jgi:ATP-dependent helicase HrpB
LFPATNTANVLPIDSVLPALQQALRTHNRCLLVAQPGAGKTTRVPIALLRQTQPEQGRWLLLEPRRVAARLAAAYMAANLGEAPGQTIGYRMRGESKVSPHTRLEVITQGVLTQMLQNDPSLPGVCGIIFDEFHERSLEADLGLTLALDVQQGLRADLRLLVMSATLDVSALLSVLGAKTPVIDCPGKSWNVNTYYKSKPLRQKPEQHQAGIIRETLSAHEGNLLVFLPGQAEIRQLSDELKGTISHEIEILPLYGQLSLARQQAVLQPEPGKRRIILSTAIAESSVTVPGVRIVVDAGLERIPIFRARAGMSVLETRSVNRASADQRRGRAGREAPGYCYRLWPEEQILAAHREPEIMQADLSSLLFELLRWGVQDPSQLSWVNIPPPSALAGAQQLLKTLGIMTSDQSLSELGKRCARWPTHPRTAVLLEQAAALNCMPLACWLVAWLEESDDSQELDLSLVFGQLLNTNLSLHNSINPRWKHAASQWARRTSCALKVQDLKALPMLLAYAYPDRIAQNQHQSNDHGKACFKLASGGQALISEQHPLSRAEYLVAVALDGHASGARIFSAVEISPASLQECFPRSAEWRELTRWNEEGGRLVGEELREHGALVLARRPLSSLSSAAIRTGLLEAVRQRRRLNWSADDLQLLGRLRLLHRVLGEPWPDFDDDSLLLTLEEWLAPSLHGLNRLEQLDQLPLGRMLLDTLDWALRQQLEQLAPSHLQVPSGSRIAVDYAGPEPVLAVKLQEMFGLTQTPMLVDGRVPILLHLLSPARRPVQVTRDLAGFWQSAYFDVRKDLRGRYPKHPWPDNPLQASPSAQTKKRGRSN